MHLFQSLLGWYSCKPDSDIYTWVITAVEKCQESIYNSLSLSLSLTLALNMCYILCICTMYPFCLCTRACVYLCMRMRIATQNKHQIRYFIATIILTLPTTHTQRHTPRSIGKTSGRSSRRPRSDSWTFRAADPASTRPKKWWPVTTQTVRSRLHDNTEVGMFPPRIRKYIATKDTITQIFIHFPLMTQSHVFI